MSGPVLSRGKYPVGTGNGWVTNVVIILILIAASTAVFVLYE